MEALRRTNLSDAVYQRLLDMIRTGHFKAGDRLPSEPELSKQLGVSRTALREGIKALAGINIVMIAPGRGTFINDDPDILVGRQALDLALRGATMKSVMEVRGILDTGIARYAALSAGAEDIEAMQAALETMKRSLTSDPPDRAAATEGDEAFHLALCAATHNKILEKMAWPLINHALLRRWRLVQFDHKAITWALEGHRKILEAVLARNPEAAAKAMAGHLEMGQKFYRIDVDQG